MSTDKKVVEAPIGDQELLKSISALLDETIKEVESLAKGEVTFQDLKIGPNEQGGMAEIAGQPSEGLEGMTKEMPEALEEKVEEKKEEGEKEEEKKDEEEKPAEEVDKSIPEELSEAKEDKEEEKPLEEEKPEEKDEDEDKEMEKFMRRFKKAMETLGFVKKSEAEEEEKKDEEKKEEEEKVEKSELKARDEQIEALQKTIEGLTKKVEDLASRPVGRKSVDGLRPIMKSEDGDGKPALQKSQITDQLLDLQKSGDKRVTPFLVTKFEQTGDMNLVKDLIK